MVSTETQPDARTIPGQRYLLAMYNDSGDTVWPMVSYPTPGGVSYTYLCLENSNEQFYCDSGWPKYLTITAWGDGIHFDTPAPNVYWLLLPLHT